MFYATDADKQDLTSNLDLAESHQCNFAIIAIIAGFIIFLDSKDDGTVVSKDGMAGKDLLLPLHVDNENFAEITVPHNTQTEDQEQNDNSEHIIAHI